MIKKFSTLLVVLALIGAIALVPAIAAEQPDCKTTCEDTATACMETCGEDEECKAKCAEEKNVCLEGCGAQ